MALHRDFPRSPYAVLPPGLRWFPAAEELRATAYEKLLPLLVARIPEEGAAWRDAGYASTSATPRYDPKNKFAVSIELTGFSVYYTQSAAEAAIPAMKEGKREVMCEQGQPTR